MSPPQISPHSRRTIVNARAIPFLLSMRAQLHVWTAFTKVPAFAPSDFRARNGKLPRLFCFRPYSSSSSPPASNCRRLRAFRAKRFSRLFLFQCCCTFNAFSSSHLASFEADSPRFNDNIIRARARVVFVIRRQVRTARVAASQAIASRVSYRRMFFSGRGTKIHPTAVHLRRVSVNPVAFSPPA